MEKRIQGERMLHKYELDFLCNAPMPIVAINQDASILFVNSEFEKSTGFLSTELIGKKPPYPWWRPEEFKKNIEKLFGTIKGDDHRKDQEELFQDKDGNPFWVKTNTTSMIRNKGRRYFVTNWGDITSHKEAEKTLKEARDEMELRVQERTIKLMALNKKLSRQILKRKRVEKELIKSREQLRDLSTYLQSVREEERIAVAREIHDELGQSLTALKLKSSWVQKQLSPEHKRLRQEIRAILEIIDFTISEVKNLSAKLRPSSLDDLGIIAAIEWQSKRFQDTTGIRCDFLSNFNEIILNREQRTTIFRVFQEVLTNIARHANATRVKVFLSKKNNRVSLKVNDNGIGITDEQICDHRSLGILGMSERARSIKGKLTIRGLQGRGTNVIMSIPLNIKAKK